MFSGSSFYFFSIMVNVKIWIETTTQSFFQFSFYSNQVLKRDISLDLFELIFLWFLPWYSSRLVSLFFPTMGFEPTRAVLFLARWWFQIFSILNRTWGNDPI